jgi:transcriptional regulator with XRE-family HTH domain
MADEYLTVEQLAQRLGWTPKTVQNKMSGKDAIFKRGIHFDSPPGMPTLFRWSAVLAIYQFDGERPQSTAAAGARQPGERGRLKSA